MMTTLDGFPVPVAVGGPDKGVVVVILGDQQRAAFRPRVGMCQSGRGPGVGPQPVQVVAEADAQEGGPHGGAVAR